MPFCPSTRTPPPPGWHIDPDTGAWMRNTIHNMGRRCRNWDYCGTGTYLITLTLNDRSSRLLGRLSDTEPRIYLSELGSRIEAHFRKISVFTPEIKVLGVCVMPDHLHGVLRVERHTAKPLGEHLRGFKIGATKIAREMGLLSSINAGVQGIDAGVPARGRGLFADGFVDTILFDEEAVANGLAYMRDNPRRLWEKRTHPELFKVLRNWQWQSPDRAFNLHFSAIGNLALLNAPALLQVQCSRQYFAYAKGADGKLLKNEPPAVITPEFNEKAETLIAAASHGAVQVNPCISHGEKEIARRAFAVGGKVIALANKGFNPLYKPGGKLFDPCANGKLLMLAPSAWPYLPGEKKITRMDACVLNRIAQLLSGKGSVEIDYKGAKIDGIDELVRSAAQALPPSTKEIGWPS